MLARLTHRRAIAAAWLLPLVVASGCALDRLPRIDPTGERILIFPPAEPPGRADSAAAAPQAGGLPGGGNVQAPPALPLGGRRPLRDLLAGPTVVGPPVGQPQRGQPLALAPPQRAAAGAEDRVVMTPERVLAPVGSEVILRAGICQASGYLRNNERIEWSLDRAGVGHFVTVGDRGRADPLRLPWQRPSKIDSHYAIGYTAPSRECLRRDTADPADDVQVRQGDAWVSVSSPAAGTSFITAFAPGVGDWAARQASAVIYWIDAQWRLPPSVTAPLGEPQTLTTTVTRKSDDAPIEGWIVRYEVADAGGALLGYEQGQAAEVVTDSRGRAAISVTPTDDGPGTATVRVTIVRPENAGAGAGPRISLGEGVSSVTWSAGGTMPGPPTAGLPPAVPPTDQPPPFEAPLDQPPITPPRPAGAPELTISLRRETPDPVTLGDPVIYQVRIRNDGTAPARGIAIKVRFDEGLANEFDERGLGEVVNETVSDLAPGESDQRRVQLETLRPGTRRLEVTVTAEGATPAYEPATFTVTAPRPTPTKLRVVMESSTQYVEGDFSPINLRTGKEADIRGLVENTGGQDATNVVVRIEADPQCPITLYSEAAGEEQLEEVTPGRVYVWRLPRLAAGASRRFPLQCRFVRSARSARVRMFVTDDSGVERGDDARFEILPAGGGGGPPEAGDGLGVAIVSRVNPGQAGRRLPLTIVVTNRGATPQRQVVLELKLPAELIADLAASQSPAPLGVVDGGVLRMKLEELAPGADREVLLPITPSRSGVYAVQGRVYSNETPTPVNAKDLRLQVVPR